MGNFELDGAQLMREQPTGAALLACARDVLKSSVLPLVGGDAKRDVLMAMNAMSIAQRELDIGSAPETAELESLSLVLGQSVTDLNEGYRQLGKLIRSGQADPGCERTRAVFVHLRQTGRDRLMASNPKVLKVGSV
jgi:hypothetical protein